MTKTISNPEHLTPFLEAVFARKTEKVTVLDVQSLTSYTDFIIIITARSARHVTSTAENIHVDLKKKGYKTLGHEGLKDGTWALLDFGDVILHVFDLETRNLYDLEGFWSDAPRLDLSGYKPRKKSEEPDNDTK